MLLDLKLHVCLVKEFAEFYLRVKSQSRRDFFRHKVPVGPNFMALIVEFCVDQP